VEERWGSIYSSTEPKKQVSKINMIKSSPLYKNINAVEFNTRDSSYLSGGVELYVGRESVIKAKYLIEKAIL